MKVVIAVSELRYLKTMRIIQRGHRGYAIILPKRFEEENELYRGIMMWVGISKDGKKLYIAPDGQHIGFASEYIELIKKYRLGLHVIKSKTRMGETSKSYPIITVPADFMRKNNLTHSDKVGIFETSQTNCIVIMPEEE